MVYRILDSDLSGYSANLKAGYQISGVAGYRIGGYFIHRLENTFEENAYLRYPLNLFLAKRAKF